MSESLAVEAVSTGRRTGSCCCSCCRSAISVGETRWSGPHRTASVPDSSATLSPVPPDSSSPLSAGASRQLLYTVSWSVMTLLLTILIAAPGFVGEWGWGIEGKQVGSMDEEPQVRDCYNITFICTPTNQETVEVIKQPASVGTLGGKGRCRPSTQL